MAKYKMTRFTIKLHTELAHYVATTRERALLHGLNLRRKVHTIKDTHNALHGQKATPSTISSLRYVLEGWFVRSTQQMRKPLFPMAHIQLKVRYIRLKYLTTQFRIFFKSISVT